VWHESAPNPNQGTNPNQIELGMNNNPWTIYSYLSLSHWLVTFAYAWLVYGFHLYIVVVIKMAEPQDDYDQNEAIMNIINAIAQYGAPN
jgi:hypothetical protein